MYLFSTRSVYGLAAILELALSYGIGCLQIKDVSKAQAIPEDYLRQLLVILKRQGFVESTRGAQGGYALKKAPSEIKVGRIIEALDGPLNLIKIKPKDATLRIFFDERQKEIEKIFDHSLEYLLLEKQKREKNIAYQI